MQTNAILRHARISPQKCRLVADMVRGQPVGTAINNLKLLQKKGAEMVLKVLQSAIANAEHNQGADIDTLRISSITVDVAPVFKRMHARAKGRGSRIVKRNSHITVQVSDGKKD
jgi:large subunit ribosomal protein L22